MVLPVRNMVLPSNLKNVSNGNLPQDLLVEVKFPARSGGRLHYQAARSWYAMADACIKENGAVLTVTSIADAYRDYGRQLSTFLSRYDPVSYAVYAATPSNRRRLFPYQNRSYWRLKSGMAPAATPGKSNHGLGLAIDVAVLNGSGNITSIYGSTAWNWFYGNAERFGFSWEEQSEPWHIRLVTGDSTPTAVIQFENGNSTAPPPIPPFLPELGQFGLWPLASKPNIGPGAKGDVVKYLQSVIYHKAGGNIAMDGDYGPKTEQRIRDLQAWFGATVDGWVGPQTWHLIDVLASQ